jgi:hypothetical protein
MATMKGNTASQRGYLTPRGSSATGGGARSDPSEHYGETDGDDGKPTFDDVLDAHSKLVDGLNEHESYDGDPDSYWDEIGDRMTDLGGHVYNLMSPDGQQRYREKILEQAHAADMAAQERSKKGGAKSADAVARKVEADYAKSRHGGMQAGRL